MRIAVTGGIAEGKSTVLGYIRDLGQQVASSDEIAREVFLEPVVQTELAALLGCALPVAPAALRDRLAAEPWLRRRVNYIMHPRVLRGIQSSPAAWIEVPLLLETCLQVAFDRVWVATCGPEVQLERLVLRLGEEGLARQLLATQLPSAVRLAFADEIVRTNAGEDAVRACIRLAVQREIGK